MLLKEVSSAHRDWIYLDNKNSAAITPVSHDLSELILMLIVTYKSCKTLAHKDEGSL